MWRLFTNTGANMPEDHVVAGSKPWAPGELCRQAGSRATPAARARSATGEGRPRPVAPHPARNRSGRCDGRGHGGATAGAHADEGACWISVPADAQHPGCDSRAGCTGRGGADEREGASPVDMRDRLGATERDLANACGYRMLASFSTTLTRRIAHFFASASFAQSAARTRSV